MLVRSIWSVGVTASPRTCRGMGVLVNLSNWDCCWVSSAAMVIHTVRLKRLYDTIHSIQPRSLFVEPAGTQKDRLTARRPWCAFWCLVQHEGRRGVGAGQQLAVQHIQAASVAAVQLHLGDLVGGVLLLLALLLDEPIQEL